MSTLRRPPLADASSPIPVPEPSIRAAKKPAAAKKKKPPPAKAKKSGDAKVKVEKKEYPLPGQKRDTPEEGDSLRKFYTSLRKQKPESEMAEVWLMEHGLLPEEEAHDAYKRMLKRKGKTAPAKKSGGGSASKPRPKTPASAKPKPKPKAATGAKRKIDDDDDDSDDELPLASLKSNGGGSGFKIPKTEA